MTERQEKVLNYLLENGVVGIRELAYNCGFNVKNKNNHDCCVALRQEIERINLSKEHNYTIVYDSDYNYWVAKDEEERIKFIKEKKLYPALKKLKSYWNNCKKVGSNEPTLFEDFIINELKGE